MTNNQKSNSNIFQIKQIKVADLNISHNEELEIEDENDDKIADLSNLDELRKISIEREPKFNNSPQSYAFTNEEERVDVYIKNYMNKFEMNKTLKSFEQEFYEKVSKGEINLDELEKVPHIYIESEKLQEEIGNIQKELDDAKIYAEKANSMFLKLNSQKENEKIKHRRVQQEKRKLIKEMEELKNQYAKDSKLYKELKKKYWDVTNQGLLLENDQAKAKAKYNALKDQHDKEKKNLEDLIKQREVGLKDSQNDVFDIKLEERVGNQIVKWTPFPQSKNINIDYSKEDPVSIRMTMFKVFPGHLKAITACDMHPKKAIMATVSDDKTWKLWKFPNGEPLMHGEGHKEWLSDINFHPEGVLLSTCGGDSTVKIWDILKQKCVHSIIDHAQPVWKNKFHESGDFLLTACMDHTVRLYDMNNYKSRMSYRVHLDSVNSINFIPDTNMFLSGSVDKTISLWDMRSNISVQTYYGHKNAINACKSTHSGDYIISSDADGIVKIWDKRNTKELFTVKKGNGSANCVEVDKSGSYAVIGYEDAVIRVLNIKTGSMDTEYRGHEDSVLDLKFDLKNKSLISTSADKTFRIWQ